MKRQIGQSLRNALMDFGFLLPFFISNKGLSLGLPLSKIIAKTYCKNLFKL